MSPDHPPSRTLHWIPSVDPVHRAALTRLAGAMAAYYGQRAEYYRDIDFTANSFRDDPCCRGLAARLSPGEKILEVGCGRANLLRHRPELAAGYTGVDFSPDLLADNARRFPSAQFQPLGAGGKLPFPDASFATVFSVYVLEHCVFPAEALAEWLRVLRPGGTFLLLCPDFLGCGRMSSQRAGFSAGNAGEKIRAGRWWDGWITLWDNRVRLPRLAWARQHEARRTPRFFVNLAPTCFTDPFLPDVDAVYVTFEPEIRQFLGAQVDWRPLDAALAHEVQRHRLILLHGVRKSA